MSIVYRTVKSAFRLVAPSSAKSILFNGHTPLSRFVLSVKGAMERSADHADVYDHVYYANYADEMARSAIGIVDSVIEVFNPTDVIDIGCGSGEVLARFVKMGVPAKGCELSPAAIDLCRSKGLDVREFDLEGSLPAPDWSADVVLSTEVAEHLPEHIADHYIQVLLGMARRAVIITAAPPGQGGTDHVNEQPYSYWIEKFARAGGGYSETLTKSLQTLWSQSGVEKTRARNVLVFEI